MFGNLSGPTLLVILFIVLLLFGAPKLPGLARSIGQSMRILKKEVTTDDGRQPEASGSQSTPPQASTSNGASGQATNDAPASESAKPNASGETPNQSNSQ